MVVGTFAAAPYIHLQLEAFRRLYPQVALLIHDDASSMATTLSGLCDEYDVDFESNDERQPQMLGDLSAFLGGLKWACTREIDLLLKVSRRWVFKTDWATSLERLAQDSQYATFSNFTTSYGFGFRTECMAMSVTAWAQQEFIDRMAGTIRDGNPIFIEGFMHSMAQSLENQNCALAERWRMSHPSPPDKRGYAKWPLMGDDRCKEETSRLWHDSDGPEQYARLAQHWGLGYETRDFIDPNQGEGDAPRGASGHSVGCGEHELSHRQ